MSKLTYTYLAVATVAFALLWYLLGWAVLPAYLLGAVVGLVAGLDLAAIKYRKEVAQILEDLELQMADE